MKRCRECGHEMARKAFDCGVMEGAINFERRKFCSRRCKAKSEECKPLSKKEFGRFLVAAA